MTTKSELIDLAFVELGIGSGFDVTPSERQTTLSMLDSMVAAWQAMGVNFGYSLPGGLTDESGVPDWAQEAVVMNLAMRRAPSLGKTPSPETRTAARVGYNVLMGRAVMPQSQKLQAGVPMGAGYKSEWRRFSGVPDTGPLSVSEGGDLNVT